jgi:hypothetical protein
MSISTSDTFVVAFRGDFIESRSLRDAVRLKRAAQISTPSDATPWELDRLADLLLQYGRQLDADDLRAMAARIRNMDLLETRPWARRTAWGNGLAVSALQPLDR